MNLEVDDSPLKCGNKKGRTISDRASFLDRELDKAPGKCYLSTYYQRIIISYVGAVLY